jgi:hypothetical protein
MAYEAIGQDIGTFTAAADLSAKQYHFVVLASATTVNVATAITNAPIGILQNKPESGQQAIVRISGMSKVVADGTLAAANFIGTSADAQADAISPGTDTTVYMTGQCVEAASAGETTTMILNITNCRAA